jgi:hypothetical protein
MKFTICGSAKFEPLWHEWNKRLGLMGHISYSLMTFPSIEDSKSWYTEDEKWTLDLAHLAKIEESDAILVLNKDGYVGESTAREIKWARIRNKFIYWLEGHEDEYRDDNISVLMSRFPEKDSP